MFKQTATVTKMGNGIAVATLVGLIGTAAGPAQASGGFNIPTDASASPLFGATPFSQKMLMFEEFGTRPMPSSAATSDTLLPTPADCKSSPDGATLDAFLAKSLYPMPVADSYSDKPGYDNPWKAKVTGCIPSVTVTRMDARPPGKWFSHQRWDEFYPKVFFQSAMAGARTNGGLRDQYQLHGYSKGEFGPGGLYYNTVFSEDDLVKGLVNTTTYQKFNGTTKGIQVRLHPKMPVQDPKSVWTFDGTLSPKLLMARYGEPVLFRHHNALPIDPAANNGFGAHTITTHEHNGHNPGESDGFTDSYSYPGEFYDYHWPMILAGHDSINTTGTDKKAGMPDGNGGITPIPGDYRETMSTHWFHDHMLDFTAQNVYKGNAAMMNYYSAIDRGNEAINDGVNLRLPSGTALDWGNRDYDVNLAVADKATDSKGQLFFNIFNTDGFLGDLITVNWLWKPYMEVRARKYRFRILNASVSRYYKIALVDQKGVQVPFHMIANDGNIMEHAVPFPNAQSKEGLPTQGIAERYDIIVDFGKFKEGDKLYFVNLLEHKDGKTPNQAIALTDIISGKYQGDPGVGKFLEFRVKALPVGQKDLSMNPVDYEDGKKTMIPRNTFTAAELAGAIHRTFEFGRADGTDLKPWTIKTDGGPGYNMDPHRISAAPVQGNVEIWHIKNGGNSWSHPVHVHFEEGHILARDGKVPPLWEKGARKDVYQIGPLSGAGGTTTIDMAIRVREFMGTYVEHCHNTQHEDKAMLLRWDLQKPGQTEMIQTPSLGWEGATYEDSFELPTAQTGDLKAASSFKLP